MNDFDYTQVSDDSYWKLIDQFVKQHGDDRFGRISSDEFDELFDTVVLKLKEIGDFLEGAVCREGAFASSRYVEPIPAFNIVAEVKVSPRLLFEVGADIVERSHRPLCISFDCEGGCIAVFPGRQASGTSSGSIRCIVTLQMNSQAN